jgi:hypothetical protein
MPWHLLPKQTWKDSLPIDMFLSAVSVLVVALPSSEVPGWLMIYPVFGKHCRLCRGGKNHVQDHIILTFWNGELLTLSHNPQAGDPHHVGCPQRLFNTVSQLSSPPLSGISGVLWCSNIAISDPLSVASSKMEFLIRTEKWNRFLCNIAKDMLQMLYGKAW